MPSMCTFSAVDLHRALEADLRRMVALPPSRRWLSIKTEDSLIVQLDAPGFKQKDLNLELNK